MTEPSTSIQSSWTLAEALIWEIAAHLRNGRNHWLSGNLEKYYWEFESITRAMYGMLDDEERQLAAIKEGEILNNLPVTILNKRKLAALLKEYDGMVLIFLHAHKLDVPPKKDRTIMIA